MKLVLEIALSFATVALWGTLVLHLPGAPRPAGCEPADSASTAMAIGLGAPAAWTRAAACAAPDEAPAS
jgi:hypothetical protein